LLHFDKNIRSFFLLTKDTKTFEEATKRFESYSHNIQDSILTIESFMGSHDVISFDLAQVISNLESIDTYTEERNVTAHIKVLEEYQRMLITERKRRSIKEVIKGKIDSADFKMNLKRRRRSQRLGQMLTPNVQQMPSKAPTARQMPTQAPTAGQMPTQAPTAGQMPTQAPTAGQINNELMLEF